ncbi:helix-turn-helix transcriptional regulator [Clostridium sp. 'deep sea']|uniref:helix-turn-helix transcriptional regulator n=1 Tax=Clostridium sp. 'deep sea' TaxID=2779445 RepID=UPI0018967217|nr:AraC family transcriptional regulator [Clostridium sp. 'deep sea']QOR34989.1 helix-turn-helix transcriptional regulator [Clostridium sp. 'deep sea']
MQQYVFLNPDDHQSMNFSKLLTKSNHRSKYYKFNNSSGAGVSEHIRFDNGIDIFLHNMMLKNNFEYKYTLKYYNYEIVYCYEGSSVGGDCDTSDTYSLNAGDIKFLKNGCYNRWEKFSNSSNWKSVSVCFSEQFFSHLLNANKDVTDTVTQDIIDSLLDNIMIDVNSPDIKIAFNQIINNNMPSNSNSRLLYLQSKSIEIISLFIENKLLTKAACKNIICLKTEDIEKIKYAKEVITNNYVDPLSVEQLAKYVELNSYKLKVGFKKIYHTTIYGYIRNLRMIKAKEYLESGEKSVIEVANLVGYANPSHFSAAFKKKYGINPSELKSKYYFSRL